MKHYNITTIETLLSDDKRKKVVRVVRLVVRNKSIDKDRIYNILTTLTTLTTISSVFLLQSIFGAFKKTIQSYQIGRKSRNESKNHTALPRNVFTTDLTTLRLEGIYVTGFTTRGNA